VVLSVQLVTLVGSEVYSLTVSVMAGHSVHQELQGLNWYCVCVCVCVSAP
jgi:hypothetical protein